MATKSDSHNTNFVEFPMISSFNPAPSSSTPIHLSGFLSGDTVQVCGDTGELQFSVQFNVHKKEESTGKFPGDLNTLEIENSRNSILSSSSSTYLTPNSVNGIRDETMAENEVVMSKLRPEIVTRLRSGVLSPVSYKVKRMNHYGLRGSLSSGKKKRKESAGKDVGNVFEKILKARSSPLRPCNSYAFFLMANWGVVKCCSFEETSKKLSRKWSKLPNYIKKEYEEIAMKDSARYKRQCMLLLRDHLGEETNVSGY